MPSCPRCGCLDDVAVVGHPVGRYFCGKCNLVFEGSDLEWEQGRLGSHRLRDWRKHQGRYPDDPSAAKPPVTAATPGPEEEF